MGQATATAAANEGQALGNANLLPFLELFHAEAYPEAAPAPSYVKSGLMDGDLRSTKCDMRMDVLRRESSAIVTKEVRATIPDYDLTHQATSRASAEADVEPRDVSLKGALQTLTAFQDAPRWADEDERARLRPILPKAIGGHRVGDRPGRVEPRAIKRRPKPHDLLLMPRPEARKTLLATG